MEALDLPGLLARAQQPRKHTTVRNACNHHNYITHVLVQARVSSGGCFSWISGSEGTRSARSVP